MGPQTFREYQTKLLSDFDFGDLEVAARERSIPKWSTLCLLRMLELPTLKAMLIVPGTSAASVSKAARIFGRTIRRAEVMVRTDGGQERTQYLRGGNTLPLREAVALACRQLVLGRHIILLEPTNRFTNRSSFNCLLNRDGTFSIEYLGPGYDVSDLNRGGVLASVVISGAFESLGQFEPLRPWDISTIRDRTTPNAVRRRRRLINIGKHILPSLGITVRGDSVTFAAEWLKRQGFTHLWNHDNNAPRWEQIIEWTEAAFAVSHWMNRQGYNWKVLVLSGSILEDGRLNYWDVVEGSTKWLLSTRREVAR